MACSCPPNACKCPGHHHAFGHAEMCGMAKGGQCGLYSPDSVINSLLSNLIFVPTEHRLSSPVKPRTPHEATTNSSLLSSHARPLDQPPAPLSDTSSKTVAHAFRRRIERGTCVHITHPGLRIHRRSALKSYPFIREVTMRQRVLLTTLLVFLLSSAALAQGLGKVRGVVPRSSTSSHCWRDGDPSRSILHLVHVHPIRFRGRIPLC